MRPTAPGKLDVPWEGVARCGARVTFERLRVSQIGRVWSHRAVARDGRLETDLSPSLTAVRGYRADRVCCKGADFATKAARFASNLDRNGSDT